jgi:ATP-binding cassette subfamily F protein 3
MDPAPTVYETLASGSPLHMVPAIRNILGGFLFSGDDVYKKAGVLSGGERTRLAVARMLLRPSNTLLLDEPTNHLDVYTREALEEALERFTGALIVVSHDRYFIDRVVEHVILVEDGTADVFGGNYSDYAERLKSGVAVPRPAPVHQPRQVDEAAPAKPPQPKADRSEQKKREKRLKKIDDEIADLESRIASAERERERNDLLLCSEEVFRDGDRSRKIQSQNTDLKAMVDLLYGKWEALAKEKEEVESAVV